MDLHLGLVLHAAGLLAVEEDLVINEQLVPLQLHPRVGVVFPDLKPQTTGYQSLKVDGVKKKSRFLNDTNLRCKI